MSSAQKSVRIMKHLFTTEREARRHFPRRIMDAVQASISRLDGTHRGRLVFVVEAALPVKDVFKNVTPRDRALQLFSELRIWDTERNNGILIYVLIADRSIEIVADRAIHLCSGDITWQRIMDEMKIAFATGRHEHGAKRGVTALAEELAIHFPSANTDPSVS